MRLNTRESLQADLRQADAHLEAGEYTEAADILSEVGNRAVSLEEEAAAKSCKRSDYPENDTPRDKTARINFN